MTSLERDRSDGVDMVPGEAFLYGDPQELIDVTMERDRLRHERDRYGEALELIRDTDWTDNALDPQRAARIAKASLAGEEF